MATRRSLPLTCALALALTCALTVGLRASGDPFEAPPTLPHYLDRLPGKPLGRILAETDPVAPPVGEAAVDYAARLLALAAAEPAAGAVTELDALLERARREPTGSAPLLNLLGDVREVFAATSAASAPAGARADYVRWRVKHAGWFGLERWPSEPMRSEYSEAKVPPGPAGELDRCAREAAGTPLEAHWLYLRGALGFKVGEDTESLGFFRRVAEDFPGHPRVEAARFMVARCLLSQSRPPYSYEDDENQARERKAARAPLREQAREAFEDYLRRYPAGRFAADVPGWLGALAFDGGDPLTALGHYVRQWDVPGHPELRKPAAFMAERCLRALAERGDDAGLREIAGRPALAMGLVYLLLNAPPQTAEDVPPKDEVERLAADRARTERWRRELLPRLAAAVAARVELYRTGDWPPRHFALLALAASGAGDQRRALELISAAGGVDAAERNDDLAYARFLALARDGQLQAAAEAGARFGERFPKSPLARGVRLRRALVLQDDHRAGEAVAALLALQEEMRPTAEAARADGEEPFYYEQHPGLYPPRDEGTLGPERSVLTVDAGGAGAVAVDQLVDTLLNFAPRGELAAALPGLPEGVVRLRIVEVVVQRALAEAEDFAAARALLTPAQRQGSAMATVAAADARARQRPDAANLLALGDAWAAARGRLVFAPLETEPTRAAVFNSETAAADANRRVNARGLGRTEAEVNAALSGRDELQHARTHWRRAAEVAPAGSAVRARALWQTLAAVPKVAVVSPFHWRRARETNLAGESRELYERLRRECPESREARELAVFYDLGPPGTDAPAEDADPKGWSDPWTYGFRRYFTSQHDPEHPFEAGPDDGENSTGTAAVDGLTEKGLARLRERLAVNPLDLPALRRDVADLRAQVHERLLNRYDADQQNLLDDLGDFLAGDPARLSPAVVRRYLELRTGAVDGMAWGFQDVPQGAAERAREEGVKLARIREAYREPAMAPFKDFLDALVIAALTHERVSVPVPGAEKDGQPFFLSTRDYPRLARMCEGFLKDYPRSRKREAILLLRARALYSAGRPTVFKRWAVWPESGSFDGNYVLGEHRLAAFEPGKVTAALDACEREFPRGRYGAEVRHLRGSLAWRTRDWAPALRLTLGTLADADTPDLHADAAARLASIFQTLGSDDGERARLMTAIRAQPGAPERLQKYLATAGPPLALVKTWALGELR